MAIKALLWMDLETTGSDEGKDCIIEVGAVVTSTDLTQLSPDLSWAVEPTDRGLGRLLRNPVVRKMHQENGLLDDIYRGFEDTEHRLPRIHVVEDYLLKELSIYQPKTVMLAGSGVGHFDRRFIKAEMPQLNNFLHYACLDVGVVRRMFEMWQPNGGLLALAESCQRRKTHRALDDIQAHVSEARIYGHYLFGMAA